MRLYSYKPRVGAPDVPRNVAISNVTDTSMTISWTANTESDFASYNLYRSTTGSNYGLPYVSGLTSPTYQDTGLTASTLYYYKVTCEDTAGNESGFSSVVSQETTVPPAGLTWTPDQNPLPVPLPAFTYGIPGTFDFDPYIAGTPGSITVETGALPPNVTIVGQTLSYDGGGSPFGHTETGVSFRLNTSAEADWQSRILGEGVVWYHDFSSDAEVSAFQWTGGVGNDPNDVLYSGTRMRRITTDGITGACLEIFRPAGNSDGPVWWRPFSPFVGGGGKGVDDPAAGSTLRTWSPTQGGSQTANFAYGYYGATANHGTGSFDGTEYYFQMRVKISASRWNTNNPDGGKLLYFSVTKQSNVNQELVTISREFYSGNTSGENYFRMYRSGGSFGSLDDSDPADNPANSEQPGGEFEGAVCQAVTGSGHSNGCWWFPQDQWVTLLYHVVLGTNSGNDTTVRVWAARQNETTYTKIWDQDLIDMPYSAGIPFGHNACILTAYMNGAQQTMATDVYHRYCQVIFSKNFIPCPQI